MNSEEYKIAISAKNVLDFLTLDITIKELKEVRNFRLIVQIERILRENKIPMPDLHSDLNDETTAYFKIDLTADEVKNIVEYFLDLGIENLGHNNEITPACAYYTSLVKKWDKVYH